MKIFKCSFKQPLHFPFYTLLSPVLNSSVVVT